MSLRRRNGDLVEVELVIAMVTAIWLLCILSRNRISGVAYNCCARIVFWSVTEPIVVIFSRRDVSWVKQGKTV
jgi:hypothetical protein